jgi:Ca-activated chloride channel homolog
MTERNIEKSLKDLQAPAPDPMARLRAKRAALAEFERANASNHPIELAAASARAADVVPAPDSVPAPVQENDNVVRLSRESTSGSSSMKRVANRGWYSIAAGVGVVAIGLTWVLPNVGRYEKEVAGRDVSALAPPPDVSGPQSAGQSAVASATDSATEDYVTAPQPEAPVEEDAAPSRSEILAAARETELRKGKDDAAGARALAAAKQEATRQQELKASAAQGAAAEPQDQIQEVVVSGERRVEYPVVMNSPQAVVSVDEIAKPSSGGRAKSDKRAERDRVRAAPSAPPPPGLQGNVVGFSQPIYQDEGRDKFEHFDVNPVHRAADDPVSTFSADVDTASYSFVRSQIMAGALPQKDAVRAEEMINYFDYAWPSAGTRSVPFKPTVVVSDSPWSKGKKLVHIGIKGYSLDREEVPPANLVLLLDVSGSMNAPNKLPLVVRSMELLLDSLKPTDTVGIVIYAGAAGTVLEPTPAREKGKILEALHSLRPGGSTAGAEGIERAYQLAEANFRKGGVNRILLATDGDFNVGIAGTEELKGFVERKREKGVYLSVLGFGQGNYRDELAQALAQNGNGVAAYIDTENEARKVLVEQATGSLFTIAKDVKFQVEFNSAAVSEYRLVGYETRALKREDFNNDAVDAGDVGAGHTVTAIYEVTPVGVGGSSDELRYEANRRKPADSEARGSRNEFGFLKMRYKLPGSQTSTLISEPIPVRNTDAPNAIARDVRFSTAVAGFAQLLRGGTFTGSLSYEDVIEEAQASKGDDRNNYRSEFIDLVRRAEKAQRR